MDDSNSISLKYGTIAATYSNCKLIIFEATEYGEHDIVQAKSIQLPSKDAKKLRNFLTSLNLD